MMLAVIVSVSFAQSWQYVGTPHVYNNLLLFFKEDIKINAAQWSPQQECFSGLAEYVYDVLWI